MTEQHTAWYAIPASNRNGFKIYTIIQNDCFLLLECTVSLKLAICWRRKYWKRGQNKKRNLAWQNAWQPDLPYITSTRNSVKQTDNYSKGTKNFLNLFIIWKTCTSIWNQLPTPLLRSTCDDLMTRFLPNADVKVKVCHHITRTVVLPAAASETEKSTDIPRVIARKIGHSFQWLPEDNFYSTCTLHVNE